MARIEACGFCGEPCTESGERTCECAPQTQLERAVADAAREVAAYRGRLRWTRALRRAAARVRMERAS